MSANKIQTLDANRFRNCVFFSLTLCRPFGNTAKIRDAEKFAAYLALLNAPDEPGTNGSEHPAMVTADRGSMGNRCKGSKVLVVSPALDAINAHMNATKERLVGRFGLAVQSRIKDGLFTATTAQVQQFEDILAAAQAKLDDELEPAWLIDYPQAIGRAETQPVKQGGLGPLFDRADYPTQDKVQGFCFRWQWLALTVPEGLPEGLKAAAQAKLEKQFEDAAEEVTAALRVAFANLVKHAADTLHTEPGEKPKTFRDSLVGNVQAFIDTFNNRNVMNDTELAAVVEQARALLSNDKLTPKALRTDAGFREQTQAQFAQIAQQVAAMVETKRGRRFDFDDEQAAA